MTTESIKRKINSSQDLQSVVKTMKALAAVSIRQYEKAVESLVDYNRTVEMGLQIILRNRLPKRVLLSQQQERLGIIIFGSDQGMCGQFNDQIAAYAVEVMEGSGLDPENLQILAVGVRPVISLEEAGWRVEKQFSVPSSVTSITSLVQQLLLKIEAWQEQQVNRIILFYNQTVASASYLPSSRQILPLDQSWLKSLQASTWPTPIIPTFTMASEQLFSALLQEYFFVSLFRACAESLASENASRLASMQAAEKNIAELLDELTTQYQQERQTSITNELLDIVSGFEAITGGDSAKSQEV